MKQYGASEVEVQGAYEPAKVLAAAQHVRASLGRPARIAFVFLSPDYIPHLAELSDTLRVDGHITDVVGCTGTGRIFAEREIETGEGCSILALDCDVADPIPLGSEIVETIPASPHAAVLLANPYEFQSDEWLQKWNIEHPGIPCIGGLASGGTEDQVRVFHNGNTVEALLVPLIGGNSLLPVISQGCRPIGEPLTVTKAEHNVVYSLGGQPAYHALESAFQTLSDSEKSNARGNLFAGIAGTEYIDDFKPGDFLIRNIIGADPDSGAVVIGGIPRIGQTLQYQLRDRTVAQEDLARVLTTRRIRGHRPFASLLFSCLGRGEKFFGTTSHDSGLLAKAIGSKPSVGFFCNGEIGPVAGLNALHSYTASAAIWIEKTP